MPTTRTQKFLIFGAAVLVTGLGSVATAEAAAPAAAGTVSLQGNRITFQAGDGVANAVHVLSTQDRFFALIDYAAPITLNASAKDRCTVDEEIVRCTGITAVTLELGDRSDTLDVEGYVRAQAYGRSGADTLRARSHQERVTFQGNSGNDVLIGGDKDDRLEAGPGRNQRTEGLGGTGDVCSGENVVKVQCEK